MPPHRRYYTIQHRLFLLEQVRIRREAGLPLEPEEDFEDVEEEVPAEEEEEEEQEPADEEEEEEQDPAMEEDVDVWPEQHAILNSIPPESATEARRRRRQQMETAQATQAISDNDEI